MEARQLFSNLHHYIKDYQGNVRCVVRHDGTLVESNEYYPYGGLFSATASVQPYKYGSKELDRTNGLDLYDSEARWYDSLLGRTTTMDPLAEKYYSLSPYLWCAGNPVKHIDLKGDSVAVLYDQSAIGHLALLIQNAEGKWAYYSYNGTNKYKSSNGKIGGKPHHDLGVQTFDSTSEFLNSDYNKEGTEEEILIDKVNNFGYEKAFVIPTTHNQDKKIIEKFLKEAQLSYNLVYRQCAQVVQNALNAGGVKTTMMDFLYFDYYTPSGSIPYMPISTFKAIQYNYPNGKLINIK